MVFLGLSALTVTMLRSEGLDLSFVSALRASIVLGAGAWSAWLGWRVAGLYAGTLARRLGASIVAATAAAIGCASWALLFWPI